MSLLPEKYFESCITYNIVDYYDRQKRVKIFPFSISQVEEKEFGYDFGYKIINNLFFIQYKRPNPLINNEFSWSIDLEQLKTIYNNKLAERLYYCLPNFNSTEEWYNAFENTYFIKSTMLYNHLQANIKRDEKSKAIRSNLMGMKSWYEVVNEKFLHVDRKNLAYKKNEVTDKLDYAEINQWLKEIVRYNSLESSGLFAYYVKEEGQDE